MRELNFKSVETTISNALSSKGIKALTEINYTDTSHTKIRRFTDVLQQFVQGYNAYVHSTTGMATVRVTDSDVLAIWTRMNKKDRKIPIAKTQISHGTCAH
jgi:hypothetical protein